MRRYEKIGIRVNKERRKYYSNSIYPTIPETEDDIYVIASEGDRYDKLALQFYNDSSLWWIIAMSNNYEKASLAVKPGVQLRIPGDKSNALQLYSQINSME